MYRKHFFLTGAVIMLALIILVPPRTALCEEPVMLDWDNLATYGWAYDMGKQAFLIPCVKVGSTQPTEGGGGDSKFTVEESTSDVVATSNLNISVALSLWGGNLNEKLTKVATKRNNTYGKYLYAHAWRYDTARVVDLETVSFTPDAMRIVQDMKNNVAGAGALFRQKCGDGFIFGMQSGREYIGMARIKNLTQETSDSWDSATKGSGFGQQVEMGMGRKLDQKVRTENLEVTDYSTGYPQGMLSPKTATDIENNYQNFLNQPGPSKPIKVWIVPYNAVPQYPPIVSPLARATDKDTCMNSLVTALLDLESAVQDANLAIAQRTQSLYALGADPKKKAARINYINQQKAAWLREFDQLLKVARDCDKNFSTLSDRCIALGKFYDAKQGERKLDDQRIGILPKRYSGSSCPPQSINIGAALKNDENNKQPKWGEGVGIPFKLKRGDGETSGTKCRVVAQLQVYPDNRDLKANLVVAKIEWGHDPNFRSKPFEKNSTTFVAQLLGKTVFSLGPPASDSKTEENPLEFCEFKDKRNPLGIGGCGFRSQMSSVLSQNGFKQMAYGCVDALSEAHTRDQQTFQGVGNINWIQCEIDKPGGMDSGTCADIETRTVTLNLAHRYDLEEDLLPLPTQPPSVPKILTSFYMQYVNLWALQKPIMMPIKLTPAKQQSLNATKAKNAQKSNQMTAAKKLKLPARQQQILQQRAAPVQGQQPQKPGMQTPQQQTPQKRIQQPQKFQPMIMPPKQNQ